MAPRCRIDDWAIVVSHDDRLGWVIELGHAASAGLVFETVRHGPAEAIAVVLESLTALAELTIAGVAPALEHPEVVSGVRGLTRAFDWSRTEVRAVVRLFEEHGLLSTAEADWLSDWTGRPAA